MHEANFSLVITFRKGYDINAGCQRLLINIQGRRDGENPTEIKCSGPVITYYASPGVGQVHHATRHPLG